MEAWREALQSLENIRVASLRQYRYFKVKFYVCFQVAHVHAETRITASLSVFSDGETLRTYFPHWHPRHPALEIGRLSSAKEAADGLCWWSVHKCGRTWGRSKKAHAPLLTALSAP